MEHKGSKWEGKSPRFKKKRKIDRKDGAIIFDNAVTAEESDYIIKDEKGNIVHPDNRMAHLFHPNYKCYLWKENN